MSLQPLQFHTLPLRPAQDIRLDLLVRGQIERKLPVAILDGRVGALLEQRDGRVAVALGDGVVQRRAAVDVLRVDRAELLEQQEAHGRGADGGGAVERVLPAAVADARRRLVLEEQARGVEVLLGGDKVQGGLCWQVSL